jgi:FAD:protein FMN transferase
MEAESRFWAMGTNVHIVVVGGSLALLEAARERVEDLERKWSRFRPTSEISLMNQLAGRPVRVSPETASLVRLAIEGARITEGRFDPTVLGAVLRAGYDRSFELLGQGADADVSDEWPTESGYDRILVDEPSATVMLPSNVGFDPGGIGKGYAADLVVGELLAAGASGACANVGGDLRVAGEPPSGGWTVAIEHPFPVRPVGVIALEGGAVATSTSAKRAWGPPEARRHHLIDPTTGEPATTGVASATILAAEGWQAEVVAKGAFLAGLSEGLFLVAATGTEGVLVDDRGSLYPSFGFSRFTTRPDPAPQALGATA